MNKHIKIQIISLVLCLLTSNLFAQTSDKTAGCIPLQVNFTAPAGSPTYYWDFKDGATSNLQNPSNIFNTPGTYDVTFQETIGGPVIGTIQIKVYAVPTLNISVLAGCTNGAVQFTNTSNINSAIPITNYVWVFGDGQSSSGIQNPTHVYGALGNYSVSFEIQSSFPTCNTTTIFPNAVSIMAPPVASFTTNPSPLATCSNTLNATFQNTSTGSLPLNYSWTFGNGQTSTLQNPPAQVYTTGQYNATLDISYPGKPGCTGSYTVPVSVGTPPVNIIAKDTACFEVATPFYTHSVGTYVWTIDANAVADHLDRDSINVAFTTPGYHDVTLTVTYPGGCALSKTKRIYVDQVPVTLTADKSFSCNNPMTILYNAVTNHPGYKYEWSFTGDPLIYTNITTTQSSNSISHIFHSLTDTVKYGINVQEQLFGSVKVTSSITGCSTVKGVLDTLWCPNALFMPSIARGCAPLAVVFSDSSSSFDPIVSWKWDFGDGTSVVKTDDSNVPHTYNTPGEYWAKLIVTTRKGCIDTSYSVQIIVGRPFTAAEVDFTADKTSVCPGEAVTLSSIVSPSVSSLIDAYHFTTEGNRSFHCAGVQDLTWTYDNVIGPQDVTLTVEYNGCYTTVNKTSYITVKGAVAKIDYLALCKTPMDYTFNSVSLNATSVTWNFGDGQTGSSTTEAHTYLASGDYVATLTALNAASGCAATVDRRTIHVRNMHPDIDVDTLMCGNLSYNLDASASTDVYAYCHGGYTWSFPTIPSMRPITTDEPVIRVNLPYRGFQVIQLVTKDINGCFDTTTTRVKVYGLQAKASASDSTICDPVSVQFTDLSIKDTTIANWGWTFGDGNTSSLQSPLHVYNSLPSGTVDVRLTVTDALGCVSGFYLPLDQYNPTSQINVSDPTLCLGNQVTIAALDYTVQGSHLTYQWDFDNGTYSTAQSNNVLYTSAAHGYNVKLVFTEAASGCKDSLLTFIELQEYPVAGMLTSADTLTALCAPQNVFFIDNSTGTNLSYYWDFDNGQTSNAHDFSLFYDRGYYTAMHVASTSFGCNDTIYKSFLVVRPEGDFDIDRNSLCKGDSVLFTIKDTSQVGSFTWAFGDGTVLDDIAPVKHKYNFHPVSGQAPARLILRGYGDVCPVEVDTLVNIYQVIADFQREDGIDTSICFNDGPYHLLNKSQNYDTYVWDFGDGQTSSTIVSPDYQYALPGTYTVELIVTNSTLGCKDTSSKEVVIFPNPDVTAIGQKVCQGTPVQLHVTNPTTNAYLWTPSTGLNDPTLANPTAAINQSVIYTVVETDLTNGCTDSDTALAAVIGHIPLFNFDTTIIVGDQIALPVKNYGGFYLFNWTPTTGLSCTQCDYPLVRPPEDVTYTLEVTDQLGCFDDLFTYKIEVKPKTFVSLPNHFTPNGDGTNDVVYVNGWGIKTLLSFEVYNRWGQLIYSSSDIREGWDGRFNGILQNTDVYAWKVKVLTWRDETIQEQGFINLSR